MPEFLSTPRSADELQRAHDQLIPIVLDEIDLGQTESERMEMMGLLQVLCWCLRHQHEESFTAYLQKWDDRCRRAGYVLKKGPPPFERRNRPSDS